MRSQARGKTRLALALWCGLRWWDLFPPTTSPRCHFARQLCILWLACYPHVMAVTSEWRQHLGDMTATVRMTAARWHPEGEQRAALAFCYLPPA